ncbi:unnamed protein product [Didymodactylos carnosus]|uniref:Uncharacterized protein n=1 Tax=Didymodactylos carnosus TaxID=1234261 RepID=A0A813V8N6_9BILA|nr:unnamed protein product [Didymodactylos carnosus]CAF0999075.1 unnamed protein product [Didymodactylos carnosus]CAF3627161.1 unnamed protein product [Didymodactylos carnosus]CAF3768586.1 unnamed protein product [Didymodactylos carnosus]
MVETEECVVQLEFNYVTENITIKFLQGDDFSTSPPSLNYTNTKKTIAFDAEIRKTVVAYHCDDSDNCTVEYVRTRTQGFIDEKEKMKLLQGQLTAILYDMNTVSSDVECKIGLAMDDNQNCTKCQANIFGSDDVKTLNSSSCGLDDVFIAADGISLGILFETTSYYSNSKLVEIHNDIYVCNTTHCNDNATFHEVQGIIKSIESITTTIPSSTTTTMPTSTTTNKGTMTDINIIIKFTILFLICANIFRWKADLQHFS